MIGQFRPKQKNPEINQDETFLGNSQTKPTAWGIFSAAKGNKTGSAWALGMEKLGWDGLAGSGGMAAGWALALHFLGPVL